MPELEACLIISSVMRSNYGADENQGYEINFVIDAVSFLLSSLCIVRLLWIPFTVLLISIDLILLSTQNTVSDALSESGWKTYTQGFRFLWQHKYFMLLALLKSSSTLIMASGEIITAILAQKYLVFGDTKLSLSIYYVTMGVGAG